MGKLKSLRSKAVHFVSDLTTVFLNPISDKPSSDSNKLPPSDAPPSEDVSESKRSQMESIAEEDAVHLVEGPDTSSFTAFLYSLLSSSESGNNENSDEQKDDRAETGKKSLLSRGKQSLRAVYQIARLGGRQSQEQKVDSDMKLADKNGTIADELEMKCTESVKESITLQDLPGTSEPSLLLSEQARNILYASLPAIVQGRKWLLLYSTWRHGISLSTLYRRSMLWPGLSLLVVGDQKGAVFGGLVEAPLRPTNKRKYQGTNSTFVFTDTPGQPVIFRPTGANRYFTLCSTDFIAIGGGGHFALYLDADLLNGSSAVSETYGNPCLANSEDFEIKQVELWGFVHGSKYDEILALSRTEVPGICRW